MSLASFDGMKIDLQELLLKKSSFTLLLAPPSWGKTQLLFKIFDQIPGKFLYIAPLVALADEFYELGKKRTRAIFLNHSDDVEKFFKAESALLVSTPERLTSSILNSFEGKNDKVLIILDEFHLFYYWGNRFRPYIWEVIMFFAYLEFNFLGLSATMSNDLLKKWRSDFLLNVDHLFLINLGNQILKTYPSQTYWFPQCFKNTFVKRFIKELSMNKDSTFLYFCQYRREVDFWVQFSLERKINALGCKGGEVQSFLRELKRSQEVKCIFTTLALSHGVNLPSFSKIFISYPMRSRDFWCQSVGRGGRRGEKFELFTFDSFCLSSLFIVKSVLKIIVFEAILRLKKFSGEIF